MENSNRDRYSQKSHDEPVDCIILLDEPSKDPLKKRLDASSSLLSSFVDSGSSGLRYAFILMFFCHVLLLTFPDIVSSALGTIALGM